MITLIFILSIVFPNGEPSCLADNLIMYKNAYQYIEANKDEISKIYSPYKPDSLIIQVSDQVITYSPLKFIDDIIQKEFSHEDDSTKSKIADILKSFPEPNFTGKRIEELSKINKNKNNNYILFFSQNANNKIIADLTFFRKDFGNNYEDYKNSYTGCNLVFLFWFNESNEIDKVIYKLFCK